MALTSLSFLLFLLAVIAIYYLVLHKWRVYVLLLASAVFYYFNQGLYLLILVSSILINYLACRLWLKKRNKVAIYGAVVFNVLLLAFFKYIPKILGFESDPGGSFWENLVIPVGLSFFTFQAIGYVLDLYWSEKTEQASFTSFAAYMSFFPQLLSGPIARGKDFLPQIDRRKDFNYDNVVTGARLILWGLFKKLVIADNLSPYTDAVFNNLQMHKGLTLVLAILAYTIQIYMDFSGYSDIAIGSAKTLGFNLMLNFRTPYFAKSVTEFWRRWHISLSSWVRDYVNTPLQFRLRHFGLSGILAAAFITFFIIGIWHGANWSYVLFGLIQGCAISYEVLTKQFRKRLGDSVPKPIRNIIANVLVFGFFSLSTILLRASISDAWLMISKISLSTSGFFWGYKQLLIYAGIGIGIVGFIEYHMRDNLFTDYIGEKRTITRWFYYLTFSLLILLIGSLNNENFIYFQF